METWLEVLRWRLGGITVEEYLQAFLWVLGGLMLSRILRRLFGRLRKWSEKTKMKLDERVVDALGPPTRWAAVVGGVYGALVTLPRQQDWSPIVTGAVQVVFAALGTWAAFRLIDAVSASISDAAKKTESSLDEQLIVVIRKASKLFVAVIVFVLVIQNLGYSVSGLLAGVGIGGIAVALAAKDALANLFGSVSIFVDRPFKIGDWIRTDKAEGVVEEVGLRSTRIRTFAKTLVTIPNAAIANMAVENWSEMPIRRVKFDLGVTYDTKPGLMRRVLEEVKRILREHPGVDQTFWIVRFTEFGDSALRIFVYYFTKTTVWDEYLSVREDVNLKIMEALESLGVEMAFPTQTVHLRTESAA